MLIQVRAARETCQGRAFGSVGREGENLGITRIDRLGREDGGDDTAVHRLSEGQNSFSQKNLNATASELHLANAVSLLGIYGQVMKT